MFGEKRKWLSLGQKGKGKSWLNGPLKEHKRWIMISRSQPGPGQLFPSSGLPTLLTIYPQLNLAQAKTIKGKSSTVTHTHTLYLPVCVCVCIVYHSWRIPRLGADVVWQAVVNRNSQWRLSVAFTIYCTCIWLRSSLNPPGNRLRAGAIWPLWVAAAISFSFLLHPRLQQVHLNIQFQLAIPVPDFFFPSLFSSTSSPVFSFCFFKRINTRARTKNA